LKKPTKRTRPARRVVGKKKPNKRIAAKQGWSPAQKKLVFPIVGGIALIAILALILAFRRKKKTTGERTTFV